MILYKSYRLCVIGVPPDPVGRTIPLKEPMDATLHALGAILLRAVPTFLLVLLLHFYLKRVFFQPLERVLEKRYEATEGARKIARESLERAAARSADYEAAMRAARAEVYLAQERLHKRLQEEQEAQLRQIRQHADQQVQAARAQLATDVEMVKGSLERDSEVLANQIADSILQRGAAA